MIATPALAVENTSGISFKIQSYNIKGLPPFAAPGWDNARFAAIAQMLSRQLQEGTAPDVVLLQEVFTKEAQALVSLSGYPYFAQGPSRDGQDANGSYRKIFSSGLIILSRHPILDSGFANFGQTLCATWDCHANKGLQFVRLQLPGVSRNITVFNTHMQAEQNYDEIRVLQIEVAAQFIKEKLKLDDLFFFGGDFNSRPSLDSFKILVDSLKLTSSGEYCLSPRAQCLLDENTDKTKLFEDSVDHIFYRNTHEAQITPLSVNRNFTETFNDKPLSDHLGYEAVFSINTMHD